MGFNTYMGVKDFKRSELLFIHGTYIYRVKDFKRSVQLLFIHGTYIYYRASEISKPDIFALVYFSDQLDS